MSEFQAEKVYIACGYTDLRRGIDGLAGLVQRQFQLDPFTNTLFLFCGRRRDRIKALYWEIFLRKSTLVFEHIVDQAMTGYNWVA